MGEGAGGAGVGTTLRVAVEADGRHQGEGAIAVCAIEIQTTGLRAAAARVSACWQAPPIARSGLVQGLPGAVRLAPLVRAFAVPLRGRGDKVTRSSTVRPCWGAVPQVVPPNIQARPLLHVTTPGLKAYKKISIFFFARASGE